MTTFVCARCKKTMAWSDVPDHVSEHTFVTFTWEIKDKKPAQQEAGPRSKRHPKSVEGLGVKGEGEQ